MHEAYLRLFDGEGDGNQQHWDCRGHLLCRGGRGDAANLDRKRPPQKAGKHGGDRRRVDLLDQDLAVDDSPEELLALDEALTNLALEDPAAAQVVKLRVFTGVSIEQAAEVLGVSRATAYRNWNYARAWLRCEIEERGD